MLRLGCQSSKGMVSRSPWLLGGRSPRPGVRHSSSGASGRAKILGTTLAISTGILGGVVGYSALDPDFRKTVEENIPGATKLIDLVLAEEEHPSPPKPVQNKMKLKSSVMITKPLVEDLPPTVPASVPELDIILEVLPSHLEELKAPISAPELPTVLNDDTCVEKPADQTSAPVHYMMGVPAPLIGTYELLDEVPASPLEEPKVSTSAPKLLEVPAAPKVKPLDVASSAEPLTLLENPASTSEKPKSPASDPEMSAVLYIPDPHMEKQEIFAVETEAVNESGVTAEISSEASQIAAEEALAPDAVIITAEEAETIKAAKIAAEKAATYEAARIVAEKAAAAEAVKEVAEKAAAAESVRITAEEAAAVETLRVSAEEDAAARIAADESTAAEAARISADEAAATDVARIAEEVAAAAETEIIAADENAAAEEVAAAEGARITTQEAASAEAVRITTEEAAAVKAAKIAAEEAAADQEASIVAEEAAVARIAAKESAAAKAARIADTEVARISAEEAAGAEVARIAENKAEAARIASEEASKAEATRVAAEEAVVMIASEKAASAEVTRIAEEESESARITAKELAAAEAARIAATEVVRIAAEEASKAGAARVAAEEAAAIIAVDAAEVTRIAEEEAAAAETARIAEEKAEAARIASEEASKAGAARVAAEEAAAMIAAEEAASAEVTRIAEEEAAAAETVRIATEEAAADETALAEAPDSAPEWSMNKASAPELSASLEVSVPFMETCNAPEQPPVIDVSDPPIKNTDDLVSAIDPPTVLEDSACTLEKPKASFLDPESSAALAITDPPSQSIPASATELSTVLEEPACTCAREQPVELVIPSICAEKPKVTASDPDLAEVLDVPAPSIVKTASVFDPPTVLEDPAITLEKPKASSLDPEISLLDVTDPPIVKQHIPVSTNELPKLLEDPSLCMGKLETQDSDIEPPTILDVPVKDAAFTPEVSAEMGVPLSFVEETGWKENTEDEAAYGAPVEFVTETDKENYALSHISSVTLCPAKASTVDSDNNSLEKLLLELCKEMQEMVACAVSEYEAYSDAAVTHINLMQKLLEVNLTDKDDSDSDWNSMLLAAQAKSDKAMTAERGGMEALVAIANLVDSINAGRMNKVTSINPELLVAEEAANKAIYQMDLAKDMSITVQIEDRVMYIYKDLVESGREQFHKEMASIMPDVNLEEKNGKLTEYELNMFITHSYKKVLILQQELAKQQIIEQARFKKALVEQKIKMETHATENVEREMDRQAMELQVKHEKKMADIREEMEEQMRSHLKRQAIAHTDHLTEMLSIQEFELTRQHKHQMVDQEDSLTKAHTDNLANVSGTVSGLTAALQARAASDSASLSAQTLWLACTSLNTTLNTGRMNGTTWEEKLQPLVMEVEQVKMAAGAEDEFVEVVLASISPIAMERGVYTEDSLKERFGMVEKMARRVAGIGEEGGSLVAYGLSFLQSLLLVNLAHMPSTDKLEEEDLAKMHPTDLVSLARHSLECGNLAMALQLMTQLTGEPGRVATDWVAEARLTLETRQAVQAVLMYSQANSCKYMPGG